MNDNQTTCWTVIEAAADGGRPEQEQFAKTYMTVVRSYLAARWNGLTVADSVEDATQEVFLECFRQEGPLARADRTRPGGFRAFLFGVVRNVARRFEEKGSCRQRREVVDNNLARLANDETEVSKAFDRAWAQAIMKQAAELQAKKAVGSDEAMLRIRLLRARFQEGQPIREIAKRWGQDSTHLHREYAKARSEFKAALMETIAFHRPHGTDKDLKVECATLLELLN